ncbi:hypothetical protein DFH06DRAFT_1326836 [Mycena polygramma]|nr:hypothetical protein DFH06DRAFT_1326836 [Mycena polygramma]
MLYTLQSDVRAALELNDALASITACESIGSVPQEVCRWFKERNEGKIGEDKGDTELDPTASAVEVLQELHDLRHPRNKSFLSKYIAATEKLTEFDAHLLREAGLTKLLPVVLEWDLLDDSANRGDIRVHSDVYPLDTEHEWLSLLSSTTPFYSHAFKETTVLWREVIEWAGDAEFDRCPRAYRERRTQLGYALVLLPKAESSGPAKSKKRARSEESEETKEKPRKITVQERLQKLTYKMGLKL